MIVITFKGGHGDGMRMELDEDYPPKSIDARCPDCNTQTIYQLAKMKPTRRGFRAEYRVSAGTATGTHHP